MPKRIAVLVSGGGTNLQALIDAQARGEIVNGEIVLVISSTPSAYALERARRAGIPACTVARRDFPSGREMTRAIVERLRALASDMTECLRRGELSGAQARLAETETAYRRVLAAIEELE